MRPAACGERISGLFMGLLQAGAAVVQDLMHLVEYGPGCQYAGYPTRHASSTAVQHRKACIYACGFAGFHCLVPPVYRPCLHLLVTVCLIVSKLALVDCNCTKWFLDWFPDHAQVHRVITVHLVLLLRYL